MRIETKNLTGAALDWAVAKAEGLETYFDDGLVCLKGQPFDSANPYWNPSHNWAQGGPIVEREEISVSREFASNRIEWAAWTPAPIRDDANAFGYGPTPLIAAMRCYVASKLGDEVEIPAELLEQKISEYAAAMGYQLSPDDCKEIIATPTHGETVEAVVNDFLDAYER